MSDRTLGLEPRVADYLRQVGVRESPVLAELRRETSQLPLAVMQISPEQGQFMAFLLRSIQARRCLEVGTFTGYSALVCALALPEDGQLVALDVSEEWTAIARRFWEKAGVARKISLRLGPAADTLRGLIPQQAGTYDFMFIDADKVSYGTYYELGIRLVRVGGIIAFDNVLWSGQVADPAVQDADTAALRNLNTMLHADERIDLSMVPIGDGLTLARRRA